jgi:hypothetical protein
MAYVEWEIQGRQFGTCNCAYGCPCQFNALPTHGYCMGMGAYQIDAGHFGTTRLDGLRGVWMGQWPGAIHEGHGSMQLILDERANDAQREALRTILSGEETAPGANVWNVLRTTIDTVHPPLYKAIAFEVDIEGRRARLVVPGVIEAVGEPIRNPVTGAGHRARIELPEGMEFTVAEMGSGTSKVTGAIAMDLTNTYGQFNPVHVTTRGIVR